MSVETINVIVYVIVVVLCCICFFITMYLYPIFLGSFPFLRAKRLTEKDIVALKEKGVCHKTTNKGLQGIQKEKTIKGSKGGKAYSTRRKKAVFFFANAYIEKGEEFNENPKYCHIVKITNLTDKQVENMRIRSYDSVIVSLDNFKFDEENKVEYIDMGRNYNFWEKILFILKAIPGVLIPNKYIGACLVSVLLGLGITLSVMGGVIYWGFKIFGIA